MDDTVRTLIELLRWPVTIFGIAAFAIIFLREPFARLVLRLRRAGKSGVEFDSIDQSVETTPDIEAAQELMRAWDNQLLVAQEQRIRDALEQLGITEFGEREKVLIRLTAATSLQTLMEQIYGEIFGSQIAALRAANQHTAAGLTIEILENGFEVVQARWEPLKEFTFEAWLGYFRVRELLEETDGRWRITLLGREFLKYLVEQGKADKSY